MTEMDEGKDQFDHRLRQEALLKEYEIAQRESESTATWLWTSAAVFIVALMTGLGLATFGLGWYENETSRELTELKYLTAGFATTIFVLWYFFLQRSDENRDRMFLRQMQIEEELGLLLRRVWRASDRPDNDPSGFDSLDAGVAGEQREHVAEFRNRRLRPVRSGRLESIWLFPRRWIGGWTLIGAFETVIVGYWTLAVGEWWAGGAGLGIMVVLWFFLGILWGRLGSWPS